MAFSIYGQPPVPHEAVKMGTGRGLQERLGYPTQKPEALLERIINASSNEVGPYVVLDPFCGCGAALAHRRRRGANSG